MMKVLFFSSMICTPVFYSTLCACHPILQLHIENINRHICQEASSASKLRQQAQPASSASKLSQQNARVSAGPHIDLLRSRRVVMLLKRVMPQDMHSSYVVNSMQNRICHQACT
jgi:hypothetical protein